MDDIEDLMEALRIIYANLARLQNMNGPEMLLLGRVETYQSTYEDASTAYHRVQRTVEELGQQLELEHQRLDRYVKQYGPRSNE